MQRIYADLKAFAERVNGIPYNRFRPKRDELIRELDALLSSDEFDVNAVIEDYVGIYRYITPLTYVLMISDPVLCQYGRDMLLPSIRPSFKVGEHLEYNLLSVTFSNLEQIYQTTDVIIPLVFHFEDISFLDEMSASEKMVSLLKYLIKVADKHDASDAFKAAIADRLPKAVQSQEKSILSRLLSDLEYAELKMKELGEPFSPKIQVIRAQVANLRKALVD